ncbi:hypothetical protein ACFVH6_00645 [Spirillospora sp. NPDC127200]
MRPQARSRSTACPEAGARAWKRFTEKRLRAIADFLETAPRP